MTFWLLVVVFAAWGVRKLWTGLVQPKVLNTVLLPGTLVGVLGHVIGLLVTGATIRETTLYKEESGEPTTTADPKPRIPILGPIVIGLLPLVACATGIYFNAKYFGSGIMAGRGGEVVGPKLPTSLAGFWQLLRDQITLVETLVSAVSAANFNDWKTSAFLYLLACLAVRAAPFPGNVRGALGAIVLLGVGGGVASSLFAVADPRVQSAWAVLNLTVATLLLLLMLSLIIRGAIGLIQVIRTNG